MTGASVAHLPAAPSGNGRQMAGRNGVAHLAAAGTVDLRVLVIGGTLSGWSRHNNDDGVALPATAAGIGHLLAELDGTLLATVKGSGRHVVVSGITLQAAARDNGRRLTEIDFRGSKRMFARGLCAKR